MPPLTDWEQAVLDELTAHVQAAGLDPAVRVTCHVVHRSPAQALMAAAEGAHLLVLGARGAAAASGACSSARSATSWCTTRRAR